jgi:methyl-accepting chemotaxis protein
MSAERPSLPARLLLLRHRLAFRFTALFLLMALLVAATGFFGLHQLTQVGGTIQQMVRTRAAQEKIAVLMKVSLQESRVHLLEAAAAVKVEEDFEFARDDYEATRDRFRGYLDLLLKGNAKVGIEPAPPGSKLEQKVVAVRGPWQQFEAAADALLARKAGLLAAAGAAPAADARPAALAREEILAATGKVETAIDELLLTVGGLMTETRDAVATIQRRARYALTAVVLASIALALLLGVLLTNRMLIRPLQGMKAAAEKVASGDLTHAVQVRGRDEIAALGAAINGMAANLKEMILKIREVTESLTRATGDIVASSDQVLGAAGVQKAAIEATAAAVGELGASTAAVAESSQQLSDAAAVTSAVITETRQAINSVAESSDVLESSTDQTSSSIHETLAGVREIAQGLDRLSASSERIASSVSQVTASTKEIEHHATESAGLAEQVLAEASGRGAAAAGDAMRGIEHIRATVGSLAGVVQSLGKRSQDIGAILTIIDDIADRTNLLALNAAILSAQAGAHGRGFGVVAAEIKRLAEKTSASVKEIGALIQGVRDETTSSVAKAAEGLQAVDQGLLLVRGVDAALGGIAASSGRSAEMSRAIQRSTAEESSAVQQIAQSIQEMASQVEAITRALKEQNAGHTFIVGHTEKMRDISLRVRTAIDEQRQGSAHMVDAVGGVAQQAESIAAATGLQRAKGAEIVQSMAQIQATTGSLVASSDGMKTTVAGLTGATKKLHDELQKFNV